MNRLANVLQNNKESHQGVFMAGTVPGFPDLETSFEIAKTIIEAGADILELSASSYNPVADGPTLQHAHSHVLTQGISKEQIFRLYKRIRSAFQSTPFFVVEYADCVYRSGVREYYQQLTESGVDSLLIPDLLLEESAPFLEMANTHKISQIFIIDPATSDELILKLSAMNSTFLYIRTVTGVTGQREQFLQETTDFIKRVKQTTPLPLIAGFGISKPEHVKQMLSAGVDGVVTCSAIINLIKESKTSKMEMQKQLQDYIIGMKNATFPSFFSNL